MLQRFGHWVLDYFHLFRGVYPLWRHPPQHYLGYVLSHKNPVVILPGVGSTWHLLRRIGDHLSRQGHPVYVVPQLGFTLGEVRKLAAIAKEFIERRDLWDVVILGYSKGGLVGKYILSFCNEDGRVKRLIAVATPFGGSYMARWAPFSQELHPAHPTIHMLQEKDEVNRSIVSIYGIWDNHIWPTEHAHLEGAKNIQVPVHGHHRIIFDRDVLDIIAREVDS